MDKIANFQFLIKGFYNNRELDIHHCGQAGHWEFYYA